MSWIPTPRPLYLEHPGYYLIEMNEAGQTTSSDGVHSEKADALQAYKLWKGLGFLKPGCTYRIVLIEAVDAELAMQQPVNEGALAECVTMLSHAAK